MANDTARGQLTSTGVINATYFDRDSNIDFYDSKVSVLTFSVLRRF